MKVRVLRPTSAMSGVPEIYIEGAKDELITLAFLARILGEKAIAPYWFFDTPAPSGAVLFEGHLGAELAWRIAEFLKGEEVK